MFDNMNYGQRVWHGMRTTVTVCCAAEERLASSCCTRYIWRRNNEVNHTQLMASSVFINVKAATDAASLCTALNDHV